jgi:hypothetical protein
MSCIYATFRIPRCFNRLTIAQTLQITFRHIAFSHRNSYEFGKVISVLVPLPLRKESAHITAEDPFTEQIRPKFSAYVGRVFEGVCQDALPVLFPEASFSRIGGWWDSEGELDVVGLDHTGRIIGGESKFTASPVHPGHLDDVEARTERIEWTPPNESEVDRQYCLFSRSGFTEALKATAQTRADVHLFSVADVVRSLTD